MKNLFLRATAIILGIVIGTAAGGYLTFRKYTHDYGLVRAFAWTGIFSAVSIDQYDKGTGDAKLELLTNVDFYSQGIESSRIDRTMRSALRMNRGLTQARLTVLEREAGNVDHAKSYLIKAQEDLKAVGWIDLSEANILQSVKRQALTPCGTAPQNEAKTSGAARQKTCG